MQDVSGMTSMTLCDLWRSKKQSVHIGEIKDVSPFSIKLKSIEENYQDYKKSGLFLITNYCDMKCCKEVGKDICHNSKVVKQKGVNVEYYEILNWAKRDFPILSAVIFGGLEPLKQMNEVYWCIRYLREHTYNEDIVIYTGYYPNELNPIDMLKIVSLGNVIIKFGRFCLDSTERYDPILGITLVSSNQFAVKF